MAGCVNPYNFVRPGELAKKDKPKGHHKFEGLSGKISCNLKLVTPIFVPDPEKRVEIEEGEDKGHKILEFFKVNNKPVIPPTEIKGMIRSVAEAASNSCFSVFDGGRLDYRTTRFKPIAGIVKKLPEGDIPGEIRAMGFARIDFNEIPKGLQTGSTVYIKFWVVNEFDTIVTDAKLNHESDEYTKGILKMTGEENIEGKKKERVFYGNKGIYEFIKKEKDDYDVILKSQIDEEQLTSENYQHKELLVDDLIYFENAGKNRAKNIARVQLPRIKYDKSQGDRLLSMYHKCKDTENLCPACKIFGTVIEKGVKEGTESFAGNVSFSVCELKGDKPNLISGQILKILSLPKPTSCNFYLIDPDDPQKVRDYDGRAIERRGRGFSPNPRNMGRVELRGRKFYWHQPYDKTLKRYTTTEEELKRNKQKLGLTSSVELLLHPAEFTFTVAFDNLADSELGLLLWSLGLEEGMGHKLGMGKPLGLGSVEINIEKLEIIDRVKRYTEIFSPGIQDKTAERQNYIDKFKKKLEAENSSKKFDDIPNISDLKKIMDLQKPPQDNVRYPGDFQWFAGHKNLPLPTIEETVNDKKQLRDCRS